MDNEKFDKKLQKADDFVDNALDMLSEAVITTGLMAYKIIKTVLILGILPAGIYAAYFSVSYKFNKDELNQKNVVDTLYSKNRDTLLLDKDKNSFEFHPRHTGNHVPH